MIFRLFDLILMISTIGFWLPLMMVLALLVRINMGNPVFFRQARAGKGGKSFCLIKFRTMTNDTDSDGNYLSDSDRLTSFGKWLRSTSLDELPELVNVLKGEMRLVGPRPLLLKYVRRYSPQQAKRLNVLPGLTGLAQIKGRNCLSWDQKFSHDTWYVKNQSLILDIKILIKTVWTVIKRDGITSSSDTTMPEFIGDACENDAHKSHK